ncbi:DUF732 domain-containing protein [Mycobacterium sherrisii]|uniref:DUF732 domain-containing protein n=1 Tax=Mycobacterium sherrisii TaxID=243061 RepID=UPI000A023A3B|nr:DUF732 domain-containing protein [Mycobacterium sherrisii]ORW75981.1 hypothetical protein AWC25_12870 [Mycobacterium sherrisii]
MIVLAAPAHADTAPGSSDTAFLATLRGAGIGYTNPGQAIAAGEVACGLIGRRQTRQRGGR